MYFKGKRRIPGGKDPSKAAAEPRGIAPNKRSVAGTAITASDFEAHFAGAGKNGYVSNNVPHIRTSNLDTCDKEAKTLRLFQNKNLYKTFFPLLIVISLQQLAALMVNMVDNIMLGTYTELALSGATLVNQIQFTLQQIAAGIGMGIVVLASQYWGQRRTEPIKKIISIGVKFGFVVGLIFFAAAQLIPTQLLSLFTNDQAVVAEGARYLRVICWTYLIFAVSNSLMYSLQSVETAAIGTVMSVSTIIINVALNSCLIYGNV